MPYVTSIERVDYRRGLRQSIEALLQERFGEEGVKLMPEIREIYDEEQLLAIVKSLVTASSPQDLRRQWAPGEP